MVATACFLCRRHVPEQTHGTVKRAVATRFAFLFYAVILSVAKDLHFDFTYTASQSVIIAPHEPVAARQGGLDGSA